MPRYGRLLTDAQWEKIRPLLPQPARHRHGGRPRAPDRKVLEGILWILRSGARWQDLPDEFPHSSTCWQRLRNWGEQGVWLNIWRAFLVWMIQFAKGRASRRNRLRVNSSTSVPAGKPLRATLRSSCSSWAQYTSPMPPAPIFSMIW